MNPYSAKSCNGYVINNTFVKLKCRAEQQKFYQKCNLAYCNFQIAGGTIFVYGEMCIKIQF